MLVLLFASAGNLRRVPSCAMSSMLITTAMNGAIYEQCVKLKRLICVMAAV